MRLVCREFGRRLWCAALLITVGIFCLGAGSSAAAAQSLTTGALSGVISDPSGAAIPGAKVTATNEAKGDVHAGQSQGNGSYLIPLLQPGEYTITVSANGFQVSKQQHIEVSVSTTGTLNFKLQLGSTSQTVEVTGQAALLQPQNANTSTTLTAKAIANFPNPGGDITFLAQIAPGAQIRGSLNGIGGGTSYTMDGVDDNDPFNNDNNSGPTNMLLGQNSVSEVTVNTNSYDVSQGRMAAGQVEYLSKAGSNAWHGDASWQWNGRALNAYDYFVKAQPLKAGQQISAKPFDNVNNWMADIGGPIVKNKLFFYVDSEGTRILLPHVSNFTAPSPAYEAYAEGLVGAGASGYDTDLSNGDGNSVYRQLTADPAALPWVKQVLALYGDTSPGTHSGKQYIANTQSLFGCNILADGSVDPAFNAAAPPQVDTGTKDAKGNEIYTNPIPSDPGCQTNGINSTTANTPETITIFRIDYTLDANNTVWGKYLDDQGTQTTGISNVNPVFDENSFQPDHQGVLDWTHIFSPNFTNEAETGFLWYSAIFKMKDAAAEHAAINGLGEVGLPTTAEGSTNFPQGRNVTQYQFIDNATWTHGRHSIKFGENFRRELVNDHDFARIYAESSADNWSELDYAAADNSSQRFPLTTVEQFKTYALDLYAGDTWQATPKVTVNYGIHATHNSNAIDREPYMARYTDFNLTDHSPDALLNVAPSRLMQPTTQLWTRIPLVIWQPRLAVAWQFTPNTLFKAGWGMFSSIAASSSAETLAANAPFEPTFNGGFAQGNIGGFGGASNCGLADNAGACGHAFDPAAANAAVKAAVIDYNNYEANFNSGQVACNPTGNAANLNTSTCVPPASITILPAGGLKAPMTYQYSASLQYALGRNASVSIGYAGSRSQHSEDTVSDNGYQTACAFCYSPLPYGSVTDPRFISISQDRYDGWGRNDSFRFEYNQRLIHGLQLMFNYAWSHCLSTGSPYLDSYNDLGDTYTTCSGQSNQVAHGAYVYQLPFHHSGLGLVSKLVNGWQVSGATFSQSGTPLFIGGQTGFMVHANGPTAGILIPGLAPYAKGQWLTSPSGAITQPDTVQWVNPSTVTTTYDNRARKCYDYTTGAEGKTPQLCQFKGNNGAYLQGPGFQWTNLDVGKNVALTERVNLRLDFQGYNVFNHANFANPSISGNVQQFRYIQGGGAITRLTSPSQGLLGSGNGGDSNPRMLAFQAKVVF